MKKLSEHVYYSDFDHSIDQPALFCIVGENETLLVDGGVDRAHREQVEAEILEITGRPVTCGVMTHWHWDHTFGFAGAEYPVLAHKNTLPHVTRMRRQSWDEASVKKRVNARQEIAFCAENIKKVYPTGKVTVQTPSEIYVDGVHLNLGGVDVKIHSFPTDHCNDASCVYVEQDATLIVGDGMCPEFYAPKQFYSHKLLCAQKSFIESFESLTHIAESHEPIWTAEDFWAHYQPLYAMGAKEEVECTTPAQEEWKQLLANMRTRFTLK